ncbi:MAG: hypothetical protein ACT4QE_13300, partial [Anaerolineales bacterium]
AAPVPRDTLTVTQIFTARHNGLSAIELLAVVYPESLGVSTLTLHLTDAGGHLIAEQAFETIAHNAPLRLTFPPVAESAGETFILTLIGSTQNNATVWAYSLDGYPRGELQDTDGDLRFSTTYTYLPADIARDVALGVADITQWALPLWLVLFAPGLLLLAGLGASFSTAWARWGVALGVSASMLAIVWLWAAVIGWQLNGTLLLMTYGVVGVLMVIITFRRWQRDPTTWPRVTGHDLGMFTLLAAVIVARFLAARDLALPAWVDSSHHALIARVLAEVGYVPPSYSPVLAVDEFTYHFGFHVLAVAFHWLTALPLPDTFLLLGNVLNGLMSLAVYTFTMQVTDRPRAGLAAAFAVGLVSLFPGYYLAWGRYTQLMGLIVLAPLLAAAWRLVSPSPESSRTDVARSILLVAVLTSGLLFVHYRVAFFFATFAWVALAAGRRGGWRRMALAALVTLALAGPWLWRLSAKWLLPTLDVPGTLTSPGGYNEFPFDYFDRPLERAWLLAALLALALKLIQRERAAWLMAGWLALTSALLNLGPGSWVVNNNSWAISLFLPGAVLVGWGVDSVWNHCSTLFRAERWLHRSASILVSALVIAALSSAAALGLRAQMTMANPTTTLSLAADVPVLEWVRDNTPPEAVFVANSWLWQNDIWAGSDGGAWLVPFAHRTSTIPPVDYAFDNELARSVNDFNQRLSRVTNADAPETLALFRGAGVTHVFIGARGGVLKPEMFVDSPHYQLCFTNGAAWVFEMQLP